MVAALSSGEVANIIRHCEGVVGAVSAGSWKKSFESLCETCSKSVREEENTFPAFAHDRPNCDDVPLGRCAQSAPAVDLSW